MAQLERANAKTLSSQAGQLPLPSEARYQGTTCRSTNDNGAVMDHHIRDRNGPAKQTRATFDKFRANGIKRRRLSRRHHGSNATPVGGNHLFGKKLVPQPQAITVFALRL